MANLTIFDWSGTVSNDRPIVVSCFNKIMHHFGKPPVTDEYYGENFAQDPLTFYRKQGIQATREELKRLYMRFLLESGRPEPIPGAVNVVKEVRKFTKVGIFSSHPEEEILKDIDYFGLNDHVQLVFGGVLKDTPNDLERLIRVAGANPDSAIYVGDTTADISVAKMTGIRCAAVHMEGFGYQKPEQLRVHQPPADHYLTHLREILPILRNGS